MIKIIFVFLFLISLIECGSWVSWNWNDGTPSNGIIGGYDSGRPYYVIRAPHGGGLLPGKFSPDSRHAFISFGDYEVEKYSFEVK